MMKAYSAHNDETGIGVVVFAETRGKAKRILMDTDVMEFYDFTEIRPRREKELDKEYRGRQEMDWYDKDDRIALVKKGWTCTTDSIDPEECQECPAKEWCGEWEDKDDI